MFGTHDTIVEKRSVFFSFIFLGYEIKNKKKKKKSNDDAALRRKNVCFLFFFKGLVSVLVSTNL